MADRALAHIEKVSWVKPIAGADNIEKIGVLGWVCIAKKGEFQEGDLCCYIEIDSKVPEREWSKFLEPKDYKVKTMKLSKFEKENGGVISQGLALPIALIPELEDRSCYVGDNVTELLGIKYSVKEDNIRKSGAVDKSRKYDGMGARHPKFAKTKLFRWLMKRQWGKDLLFLFLGKKRDEPLGFPKKFEFVHKTDEPRCENLDQEWLFSYKKPLVCTCKVDGTSATYILERKRFGREEFYVCSRNIRQLTPDQKTYHKDNVYWEAEFKYNIRDFLHMLLTEHPKWKYVCLQGEIAGERVQGNPHRLKGINFFGFNLIDSINGRWNSIAAKELCQMASIPWVPIVDDHYVLPDDMETLKKQADGPCDVVGSSGLREGFVYRSVDDNNISFKNVSRKYLLSRKE